ncbi:unnamed protein product, partial [Mesorhabditis spiculigera]
MTYPPPQSTPTKDVLEVLPFVQRCCTRGEITLTEYYRDWPVILCCEMAMKVGLNLVYKLTTYVTPEGPKRACTLWMTGISFRFIGFHDYVTATIECDVVREALRGLYLNLISVGAVPNGVARLCSRYDMLRPVVLMSIPWFQHMQAKMEDPIFIELKYDNPENAIEEERIMPKLAVFKGYMKKWSERFWTKKTTMRCPSYADLSPLKAMNVLVLAIPNDQFKAVYDNSGWKLGKLLYADMYLPDPDDPQLKRTQLHKALDTPPAAAPHPLVDGIPEEVIAENIPPMQLHDHVDFINGGPVGGVKVAPEPPRIQMRRDPKALERYDTLYVGAERPKDFQVTIRQEERRGLSYLVHNISDRELDPKRAREKEMETVMDILRPSGVHASQVEIVGRVTIESFRGYYKYPSLHIRLLPGAPPIDAQQIHRALQNDRRHSKRGFGVYTKANEEDAGKHDEREKRKKDDRSHRRRSRSRSRSRTRDRSRDRRRNGREFGDRGRNDHTSDSIEVIMDKGPTALRTVQPKFVPDREMCAHRIKKFVTKIAESADCKLMLSHANGPRSVSCQAKMTDIPFMFIGAYGVAVEKTAAENLALVSLMSKMIELGILPEVFIELISSCDEWLEPAFRATTACMNYVKAVLKSPVYAGLLAELAQLEQAGQFFLPPQNPHHEQLTHIFADTIRRFSENHWANTIVIAPGNAPMPEMSTPVKIFHYHSPEARAIREKEKLLKEKEERREKEAKRKEKKRDKDRDRRRRVVAISDDEQERSSASPPMDEEELERETLRKINEREAELERKNKEMERCLELYNRGQMTMDEVMARIKEVDDDLEKQRDEEERRRKKDKKRDREKKSDKPSSRHAETARPKKSAEDACGQRKEHRNPSPPHEDEKRKRHRSRFDMLEEMHTAPSSVAQINPPAQINPAYVPAPSIVQPALATNQIPPQYGMMQQQQQGPTTSYAGYQAYPPVMQAPAGIPQHLPRLPTPPPMPPPGSSANQMMYGRDPIAEMAQHEQQKLAEKMALLKRLHDLDRELGQQPPASSMAPVPVAQNAYPQQHPVMNQPGYFQAIPAQQQYVSPWPAAPTGPANISIIDSDSFATGDKKKIYRESLPDYVPDWCIHLINDREGVTAGYLKKICLAVKDKDELLRLIKEPKTCHVHDITAMPCPFHRHVGLHHKMCAGSLPWSRRVRLADLNGICMDKRVCIKAHQGNCHIDIQKCISCQQPHYIVWCVQRAKQQGLYDV